MKSLDRNKIKIILTAHNLEDQVETFFIRLSRGSGLTGLSSMKSLTSISHSVKLYRPLLDTNKIILVKISKKVFGVYFNDPSNQNKKFLRTKVRNLKKHLIESGIEYDQIIKAINNLNSSKLILDKYYKKIFKETVSKTRNEVFIHFKRFKDFEDEIKQKINFLKNERVTFFSGYDCDSLAFEKISGFENFVYPFKSIAISRLIEAHKSLISLLLKSCILKNLSKVFS